MADVSYTFHVDRTLKEAFAIMAVEKGMTAEHVLRQIMFEALQNYRRATAYEIWARRQIGAALDDAGRSNALRLSFSGMNDEWNLRKGGIGRRA